MKTAFASALIFSAAVAFVTVAAAPCNTTALAELTTTENVSTCSSDSGYSFTSMAMPSNAQITAFCNSDACQESLNAVKQVAPDECTIGSIRLYADVINPLSERCDMKSGSATAAGSMKAGSGPTDDDVGNTTSPASACMAGSAMDQPNSTTPQPNTRPTTRSPSPNSSPVAAGNGGTDTPTLSMCAAIAVLATVVAAIL